MYLYLKTFLCECFYIYYYFYEIQKKNPRLKFYKDLLQKLQEILNHSMARLTVTYLDDYLSGKTCQGIKLSSKNAGNAITDRILILGRTKHIN